MLTDSIRGLLVRRRSLAGRYAAVSVVNVVNHQALLNLANSGWGWSGGQANVFAAVIAAVPGYLLSRQWVWKMQGTHSIRDEIAPFWILALLGLVVSTVLAEAADRIFETWIWVAGASLFGYFVVWVLKFIVLDRLFERAAARRHEAEAAAATTGSL
ncbi:MAG: GtrA family protein [Actinomycetota bacterium]